MKEYYNEIYRSWLISCLNIGNIKQIPQIKKLKVIVANRSLEPNTYASIQLQLLTQQKPNCRGWKQKKTKVIGINQSFVTIRKKNYWNLLFLVPTYLAPTSLAVETITQQGKLTMQGKEYLLTLEETQFLLRLLNPKLKWGALAYYTDLLFSIQFNLCKQLYNSQLLRMLQWPVK